MLVLLVAGLLVSLALRNPLKWTSSGIVRCWLVRSTGATSRMFTTQHHEYCRADAEVLVTADGLPDISIARGAQIIAEPASTAAAVLAVRVPIERVVGQSSIKFKIQSKPIRPSTLMRSQFLIPR